MIKVDKTRRTVRECSAPYIHNGKKGELITDDIRVRYFAFTTAEIKQMRSDALAKVEAAKVDPDAPAEVPWLSTILAQKLESLPDLGDEKGNPLEISEESLDTIAAYNLQAIEQAIEDDLVPKSRPSK